SLCPRRARAGRETVPSDEGSGSWRFRRAARASGRRIVRTLRQLRQLVGDFVVVALRSDEDMLDRGHAGQAVQAAGGNVELRAVDAAEEQAGAAEAAETPFGRGGRAVPAQRALAVVQHQAADRHRRVGAGMAVELAAHAAMAERHMGVEGVALEPHRAAEAAALGLDGGGGFGRAGTGGVGHGWRPDEREGLPGFNHSAAARFRQYGIGGAAAHGYSIRLSCGALSTSSPASLSSDDSVTPSRRMPFCTGKTPSSSARLSRSSSAWPDTGTCRVRLRVMMRKSAYFTLS